MTHEIEVKVKVENVVGEIVFFVSDMPRIESSVRKNLANFDNWQYAKWTEKSQEHCIYSQQEEAHLDALGSLALSQDLANDTIRIALGIVGIDPNSLTQFERASAILDMAQEYKAMIDTRNQKQTWKALYVRTWERTLGEGL